MKKQVLFIQGGGDDGYTADTQMATSLKTALGNDYELNYPPLQSDESLPDFGWLQQIGKAIDNSEGSVILVAHSLGASMVLKYLSEIKFFKNIRAIFLLATPFWSGNEDWKKGLILQDNFADKLPADIPIFLYHSKDDQEVPVDHLSRYIQKLPKATVHVTEKGGHQFNDDLQFVARAIKKL